VLRNLSLALPVRVVIRDIVVKGNSLVFPWPIYSDLDFMHDRLSATRFPLANVSVVKPSHQTGYSCLRLADSCVKFYFQRAPDAGTSLRMADGTLLMKKGRTVATWAEMPSNQTKWHRYLSAPIGTTEICCSTPESGWRFCMLTSNMVWIPEMSVLKRGNDQNWRSQFQFRGKSYIRSSGTTGRRLAAQVERSWTTTTPQTRISRLKERTQITNIFDQLIRNSWNLIWQKVPRLELPVSIGKVCGFLDEEKLMMVFDANGRLVTNVKRNLAGKV